ncbi:MAG: aromatic acid/H+ symport family MFS transporter, partial [Solimonas sp.]
MGINLPLQLNFMAFAVPGVIAALAMLVYTLSERRTQPASAPLLAAKA